MEKHKKTQINRETDRMRRKTQTLLMEKHKKTNRQTYRETGRMRKKTKALLMEKHKKHVDKQTERQTE